MQALWKNAILPLLISGLILFVTKFFGTDFIGWVESVTIVVLPLLLLVWSARRVLRAMNPLLSRRLPNFCGQRPNQIISKNLTYIDVVGAIYFLEDTVRKDKFVPDLVVGVDRGGAAVGGMLAKLFHCPFSHIAASQQWCLSSAKDSIDEGLKNSNTMNAKWQGQINNVLIVDDACRSGDTLETAITYIKKCTHIRGQIKTATILNELRPHKTMRADYICFNTYKTDPQQLRLPWDLGSVA